MPKLFRKPGKIWEVQYETSPNICYPRSRSLTTLRHLVPHAIVVELDGNLARLVLKSVPQAHTRHMTPFTHSIELEHAQF